MALIVPAGMAGFAQADHNSGRLAELCPAELLDRVSAAGNDDSAEACVDNPLTAPGAHADITRLEVTSTDCQAGSAVCELQIEAETEHWAWNPNSRGELRVQAVGPTGATFGQDDCEMDWQFSTTCRTDVTLEHLAPTGPFETKVEEGHHPTAQAMVSPQSFCALAVAETTPRGEPGHNDERDLDPARDVQGTCVDVDQQLFNGAP